MTDVEQRRLLDLSRGDPELDQRLQEALDALADRSGDPKFASLVDDLLDGRVSLREAARRGLFDEGFSAVVREGFSEDDDGADDGEDWNVRTFR